MIVYTVYVNPAASFADLNDPLANPIVGALIDRLEAGSYDDVSDESLEDHDRFQFEWANRPS